MANKWDSASPINACLIDELQVGFVNQFGRSKRMVLSLPTQGSRGNRSQLGVDVRKQLLGRLVVPWLEFLEEVESPEKIGSISWPSESPNR